MASGSWNFGTSNPFIEGRVEWWSISQGAVNNYSNVRIKVSFHRTNSGYQSWGMLNTKVRLDTQNNDLRSKDFSTRVTLTEPSNWVTVTDDSGYRVYHNPDGSKSCYIRVYGDADFGLSFDSSRTVTFGKIARYTSITNWKVSSVSASSLTFIWSTADNISNIICNIDGITKYSAGSLNTNSGSFTIGGLPEATTYSNITIIVTRKDSGLTTTSNAIPGTTNYIAPTASISLQSCTINSIQIAWSSNFTCNAIWIYNNGTEIYSATVNSSSGSVTLSPNNWSAISYGTTYSLTVKVRRAASLATAVSSSLSASTLQLPYIATSTPNSFIIGDNIPVTLLNSANNAVTLYYQICTATKPWFTVSEVNVPKGVSSITMIPPETTLYQNCPIFNTLDTRIECSVTNNKTTYTSHYNITANVINSDPTFTDFSWTTNVGTPINDVISGTTNMITDYGNLILSFADNSALAKNFATLTTLEIKIIFNNSVITTDNIPYSSTAFTYDCPTQNISKAGTYTVQIVAIDSRKNRSTKVIHSFIAYPYHKPRLYVEMTRQNNFERQTYLKLNGLISKLKISSVPKNALTSLKFRYAESGGTFSPYNDLDYSNASTNDTDDFEIIIAKTSTDNYFKNLDLSKSYVFQFVLTDKLYTSDTFEVFIAQGQPLLSVSDDGYIAIDKVPDYDSHAKLQVNSDIMACDSNGREILLVEAINKINDDFLNKTYPIGSIYMSLNNIDPRSLFGGTWVQWGAGRFPVCVDTNQTEFNIANKTGGEKVHALQSSEVPAHAHTVPANTAQAAGGHGHTTQARTISDALRLDDAVLGWRGRVTTGQGESITSKTASGVTGRPFYIDIPSLTVNSSGVHTHTVPASTTSTYGTSGAHNNLPPYVTCYMWQRTA